jgi:hypothetical protein
MKENSYLQIKNYFENLVQQSKFLNDFVGFFSREWAEKKYCRTHCRWRPE